MAMHIHNVDQFQHLQQSALDVSTSPKRSPVDGFSGSRSPPTIKSTHSNATDLSHETHLKRVALKHDLYVKEHHAMQVKLHDHLLETIERKKAKRDGEYCNMLQEIENGKVLLNELRTTRELQDQYKLRQKQRVYNEWNQHVYHKLNDPIHQAIHKMDSKVTNIKRHESYQKFLDVTNKKGGLYRDIIIESEYNPLQDIQYLSYHTPLDDPLHRILNRREEENQMANINLLTSKSIDKNFIGMKEKLGRHDNMDVKLWAKGVYESTPEGYFNKMMNPSSTNENKTFTNIHMDHYNIPKGIEIVNAEYPKGKRTEFDTNIKIPKSTIHIG